LHDEISALTGRIAGDREATRYIRLFAARNLSAFPLPESLGDCEVRIVSVKREMAT
jgi:hypothetical protein